MADQEIVFVDIPDEHKPAYRMKAIAEASSAIEQTVILVNYPQHGNEENLRARIVAHLRNAIMHIEGKRATNAG